MKLLTVASHLELDNLVHSAQKFGWDIEIIMTEWRGFGTKLIEVYNYLKKNPDVKEFIFVDAYDVVTLSTPKEVETKIKDRSKMLVSVEKGCWPQADLASQYPKVDTDWKYVNSGTYYAPSDVFIDMFEKNPPPYTDDDQLWLTKTFLANQDKVLLDYNCDIFQCYSFIADDDFTYNNSRLQNLKTNTEPILVHSNGRTDNSKILELL